MTTPKSRPRLLDLGEVASELRISERTVRKYIKTGGLPIVRLSPGAIRVDRADLDAFIDERREREAKP